MKRYAALYKGKFMGEDDKVMSEFNEGEWVRYEEAQAEIDVLTKALKKVSDYNLRLEHECEQLRADLYKAYDYIHEGED